MTQLTELTQEPEVKEASNTDRAKPKAVVRFDDQRNQVIEFEKVSPSERHLVFFVPSDLSFHQQIMKEQARRRRLRMAFELKQSKSVGNQNDAPIQNAMAKCQRNSTGCAAYYMECQQQLQRRRDFWALVMRLVTVAVAVVAYSWVGLHAR